MNVQLNTSKESRQERAIMADLLSNERTCLRSLWHERISGACRVVDAFFTEDRCYVIATMPKAPTEPLAGRRLTILQGVLCGEGQKSIAIELKLAPSTVALNARLALETLGVLGKPSRVHPLLMLAATAACVDGESRLATLSRFAEEGELLRVLAVPRPDTRLTPLLPPAELEVVRYLVQGLCYQEIAQLRGTSTRTVANQITAVFRRLRVSGRNELLQRLFASAALPVQRPASVPPPVPMESMISPSKEASESDPLRHYG